MFRYAYDIHIVYIYMHAYIHCMYVYTHIEFCVIVQGPEWLIFCEPDSFKLPGKIRTQKGLVFIFSFYASVALNVFVYVFSLCGSCICLKLNRSDPEGLGLYLGVRLVMIDDWAPMARSNIIIFGYYIGIASGALTLIDPG